VTIELMETSIGVYEPRHRPCELCGAQPETIYGPDYRFGKDRAPLLPHVYTSQCGARDCYKGVQFSGLTMAIVLGMWDQYEKDASPTSGS
jgi:hypothetical protein